MVAAGVRRLRIAGWVILTVSLAYWVLWAALVWLVMGLALWGAGALGWRLGERLRANGRGGHA
jgi:hypothetical protein